MNDYLIFLDVILCVDEKATNRPHKCDAVDAGSFVNWISEVHHGITCMAHSSLLKKSSVSVHNTNEH